MCKVDKVNIFYVYCKLVLVNLGLTIKQKLHWCFFFAEVHPLLSNKTKDKQSAAAKKGGGRPRNK